MTTSLSAPATLPRLLAARIDPTSAQPAPLIAGPVSFAAHRASYGPPPIAGRGDAGRQKIIDLVNAAGLRGRGGAGFPTGRKLTAVAAGRRRPVVVVNGCESEAARTTSGDGRDLIIGEMSSRPTPVPQHR